MANGRLTLHDLVESIMNAVADSQDRIERQTIDNIEDWFDADGRPKMIDFKVPSLNPADIAKSKDGVLVERGLSVPLLTLMQNNPIKIKKLVAKFQINLGGVTSLETKGANSTAGEGASEGVPHAHAGSGETSRTRKILSADIFGGCRFAKKDDQKASIEVEFESGEPTEAYLRLQNELLKLI